MSHKTYAKTYAELRDKNRRWLDEQNRRHERDLRVGFILVRVGIVFLTAWWVAIVACLVIYRHEIVRLLERVLHG